jgi:pseudouridine synthase
MSKQVRLQKYLSNKGLCSRRKAEEFILKGYVRLNGEVVTQLGTTCDPAADKVELSEEAKSILSQFSYIKYYKPKGVVTHSAQQGEQEIADIIDSKFKHCAPIGRLDKDSEGLILLSDDGVFAKNCLNHTTPHQRDYLIKVSKPLTEEMIDEIEEGMIILGKKTLPCSIEMLAPLRYKISLFEGKNRQVRRMILKVGNMVMSLKRVQFGPIKLGDLAPNQVQSINPF